LLLDHVEVAAQQLGLVERATVQSQPVSPIQQSADKGIVQQELTLTERQPGVTAPKQKRRAAQKQKKKITEMQESTPTLF
jgi:hypothetical protein